ncbi:hypothetical protein Tco_1152334, partial [Tanacetum coccineum]
MLETSAERMNPDDTITIETTTRDYDQIRSGIQEELYEESSDQEEFYDEDSSDLEEYLRMFECDDKKKDLVDRGTKLHGMKELIHGKRQNQQFAFFYCSVRDADVFILVTQFVQLKDLADDNQFNADAFREYTPPPEEGIRHPIVSQSLSTTLKRESPAADVLTVGTSRNVRRRLSIGNHDVVMHIIYTNYGSSLHALISAVVHSSGNGSKNAGNLSRKEQCPRCNKLCSYKDVILLCASPPYEESMRYLPFTKHGFNEFKLNEQRRMIDGLNFKLQALNLIAR